MGKPYWFRLADGVQKLVIDVEAVREACHGIEGADSGIFRDVCTELGIKVEERNAPR